MKAIQRPGGQLRGYIKETSEGKELLAPGGRLLGYYNEQQDKTYRPGGSFYGTSDQLMDLLED
jgi:hypothetical protein